MLLIGVAASSSFQHSRYVTLGPGQAARVDGLSIRYVRATESATSQKISFGAILAVYRGRSRIATLNTSRGYYPAQDSTLGPLGRFFNGGSDSNVGLRAGAFSDIWTVVNPGGLAPLQPYISQGDRVFQAALMRAESLPPARSRPELAQLFQLRDVAIAEIAARYATHPFPVEFLLIVSPLVTWIWVGTLIIATGGLIALWPFPALAWRRVRRPAVRRAAQPPVAAGESA